MAGRPAPMPMPSRSACTSFAPVIFFAGTGAAAGSLDSSVAALIPAPDEGEPGDRIILSRAWRVGGGSNGQRVGLLRGALLNVVEILHHLRASLKCHITRSHVPSWCRPGRPSSSLRVSCCSAWLRWPATCQPARPPAQAPPPHPRRPGQMTSPVRVQAARPARAAPGPGVTGSPQRSPARGPSRVRGGARAASCRASSAACWPPATMGRGACNGRATCSRCSR